MESLRQQRVKRMLTRLWLENYSITLLQYHILTRLSQTHSATHPGGSGGIEAWVGELTTYLTYLPAPPDSNRHRPARQQP